MGGSQVRAAGSLEITFPAVGPHAQDREWCEVRVNGVCRRIRFHDYHEIYAIPGLYEQLFYERLECSSPQTVCTQLAEVLHAKGVPPGELRVLEVGAGNGMVGELLRGIGVRSIVGLDIIEEAAAAAQRDRPGVYDDYLVLDLTEMSEEERRQLTERRFNCLVTVAALGFGDIPLEGFAAACNVLEPGALIAFNIKEDFIVDETSGFARLVRRALAEGRIELQAEHRYRHRLSSAGEPIYYIAMVAEKRAKLPSSA
jgi:predicted TPR repeat methyltransferase